MPPRTSGPSAAPALDTPRLHLRAHALQDFESMAAMWAEVAVYHHIFGRPLTSEESWSRLLRYRGHWALLGYGYWAIEEKATGTYIGEMGYADYHRQMSPGLQGRPELGWALTTSAQGKGYATEALKEIVGWGDAHLGSRETACMISPENAASLRVADKLGFTEHVRSVYKGDETVVLFRTTPF